VTTGLHQKTVLPNGIRVISEYVDTVYSVALGFYVLAGSQNETKETNGLAHLLEHMAFKGTNNRTAFQIGYEIESIGGNINAYTSKSSTCFYVRMMSETIDRGVDVLSDLILNPVFDPGELAKEKDVIIEEIKEIEDNPGDIIHDYFSDQIFPEHPFGRPIQGTIENVRSFTEKHLNDFIRTNYTGKNLVVAASGRIEHQKLVELVEKYMSSLPAGNGRLPIPDVLPVRERQKIYAKPISQAHLVLGKRIFPQTDPRRYTLGLLNVLLSGGMTSRLFNNIREKYGFVYEIYSFSDLFLSEGAFGIYAGADTKKLDKVRSMIYQELEKVVNEPIPEDELKKIKQQSKSGTVLGLEGMQSRMSHIARMEIHEKRAIGVDEILEIIDKISARDLQELSSYIYDNKSNFIETIIVPKNGYKRYVKNQSDQ